MELDSGGRRGLSGLVGLLLHWSGFDFERIEVRWGEAADGAGGSVCDAAA